MVRGRGGAGTAEESKNCSWHGIEVYTVMEKSPRCLYENDICSFIGEDNDAIFGMLCKSYHGDAPTTTRDAWEKTGFWKMMLIRFWTTLWI